MKLRLKFILFVITPLFVIFSMILALGLQSFERNAHERIARSLAVSTERQAAGIEVLLREAAQVASSAADYLGIGTDLAEDDLFSMLRRNVAGNPLVFGSAIAFETDHYPGKRIFAPYVYRKHAGSDELVAIEVEYDYTEPAWDWWHMPRKAAAGVWTEPFFDEGGGNILMTTFSAPFYREGHFTGVATVDLPLEPLNKLVSLPVGDGQRFVLLSGERRILYSAKYEHIGRPLQEVLQELGREEVGTRLDKAMSGQEVRTMRVDGFDTPEPLWVSVATIPSGDWVLLSIQDEEQVLAFLNRQKERAIVMLAVGFLLSAALVWALVTWVTRPLQSLSRAVEVVGQGRLDTRIRRESGDEIGDLAERFDEMLVTLSDRESALKELNETLEQRVENRTRSLEASEEKFRTMVANIPGVVYQCQLDESWTMLYISDGIKDLSGYPAEDFIGNRKHAFADIMHPDELVRVSDEIAQAIANRTDYLLEYRIRRADGEERWVNARGQAAYDEQGVPLHLDGAIFDVTERHKLQDELHKAVEAADTANRAKSAFLANMSHELRTPMNAIIGYSEMLQEEAEELGQEEFVPDLEKIHGAGKHLLSLINDILDLSKIEAGRMDLYLERFELDSMLSDVVGTITPLIEKNSNTLLVDFADDLGAVRADLTKVRQSLFNLLSNAAKFTENGTITLAARREKESGRDWVMLSVQDEGIGIPADKIQGLFGEFTQADESTTRNYGGTGLGLAISRRFCQMMAGNITVESTPGEGSTFTIRLPAEVDALEAARRSGERTESEGPDSVVQGQARVSANRKTILIIDDDADTCDMLRRTFEKDGYGVAVAMSAEDGLQMAHELMPDAITLDVMMPGTDGWTLLRNLKSDSDLMNIPVIMLTMVDDKGMGYTLGAAEYLTKPVDRGQLLQILGRYTDHAVAGPVLVVDDDVEGRGMLCRLLEKEGLAVKEAGNGREALESAAQLTPSIIMLDLMMPVMDGFEFVQELRKREAWRQVPIIVLTAMDLDEKELAQLNLHVESVIRKGDLSGGQVLQQVRDALENSAGAD
jgi:PAS domain S-box-containing protein